MSETVLHAHFIIISLVCHVTIALVAAAIVDSIVTLVTFPMMFIKSYFRDIFYFQES